MNKGIKKIIRILEHPRHKQIRGMLIKFATSVNREKIIKSKIKNNANDKYLGTKIIGKCALGEIGCQIGFKPSDLFLLDLETNWYYKIMQHAKVPKFLVTGNNLPHLHTNIIDKYKKENIVVYFELDYELDFRLSGEDNIDNYIYSLNDIGFTYKQIAEFLKITFGSIK